MKTAIGYCRVSTEGQANEGVSLSAQEAAIREWCGRNGFEPVIYKDKGLSGKRADNRPALQKAVREACKAKAPFVTYNLSRFSRSLKDCIELAERLHNASADFVSLSEAIDTTSPTGKLTFHLLGALNQFQRELISQNTTMALGHMRKQNKRISRHIPFGYDLGEEGELTPNEREQEAIGEMKRLRSEGASYPVIAEAMIVPCKNGGTWQAATVFKVLAREGKL